MVIYFFYGLVFFLENISIFLYDFLVVVVGFCCVWFVVLQFFCRKQFFFEVGDYICVVIIVCYGVVVVGGGVVGIEMVVELKFVQFQLKVMFVYLRDKFFSLELLLDEVKDKSLELLFEVGVGVRMSIRLDKMEEVVDEQGKKVVRVWFIDGESIFVDQVSLVVFWFVLLMEFLGVNEIGVLDEEGYVKIQSSLVFLVEMLNWSDYFVIGDLVKWLGIKRCGGVMYMGFFVGNNIYQRMIEIVFGKEFVFFKLDEILFMIGLVVGKKVVLYWFVIGVLVGEDVLQVFFGDDFGFMSKCFLVF